MMQDIWKLFPRLVEQKIAALLDEAEPNRMKAFQLYKTCQNENLWNHGFVDFAQCLREFFAAPLAERSKSRFDIFLNRPMHKSVFEQFRLDFRSADVCNSKVLSLSNWTHNMMRLNCPQATTIVSMDVISKTYYLITHPPIFEKATDIEFEDFCRAWKRVVFSLFGNRYDKELQSVLRELERLDKEQKEFDRNPRQIPGIYMTQTEIDWTEAVLRSAQIADEPPRFPLSRGPQKTPLAELHRVVQLYSIVLSSDKPELQQHRENVRNTLIHRCTELLKNRAA